MTAYRNVRDPALYRKMSEPHPSIDAAQTVIDEFFADLKALREKHRIRDIVVTCQIAYVKEDGSESLAQTVQTIGSSTEAVGMVAVAYGNLRGELQSALDDASRSKKK